MGDVWMSPQEIATAIESSPEFVRRQLRRAGTLVVTTRRPGHPAVFVNVRSFAAYLRSKRYFEAADRLEAVS